MVVAVDKMTVQDKLLLAQAVYKVGASNWPAVSKLLTEHPCCKGRAELFTPENCENSYVTLMQGIEVNVPAPDSAKPQAKVHLQLAQTFYVARMQELKEQIMGYEARFTELMSDINGIKAGEMDDKIKAEIRSALNRKYGKKLVDSWAPDPAEVKKVIEAGPESAKTPEPQPEPTQAAETDSKKPEETSDIAKEEEKKDAEEPTEKPAEQAAEAAPSTETETTTAEATVDETEAMDVDEVPEASTKEPSAEAQTDTQPAHDAAQAAQKPTEDSTVEPSEEPEEKSTTEPAATESGDGEADAKVSVEDSSKEPSAEVEPEEEKDKEKEQKDAEEQAEEKEAEAEEEEEEKPTTRSSRRKGRKSTPTVEKKDAGSKKANIEIEEQAATPTSDHGSEALSDVELSPLPADESAVADAPPSSPTPAQQRGRKRRGDNVPKAGRPSKRGRKGSAAVEGDAEAEGDAEEEPEPEVKEEVQEEVEEETPRGRRGRRRRGESPAKEASPPVKRGASASSTASGTPQTEGRSSRRTRQPRGSMRDDVVSKSVRAASEAISVKEEEEEKKDDHSEEEAEEKRSTRSRRKAEAAASAASTPVEKRTSKRNRTPRPAARESAGGEADDEDDSGPSASVSTPASSVAPPTTKSQKTMQKLLLQLLDSIQQHKYGPVFANPVRKNEAADYYEIIKRPMDLKTLRARIKDGSVGNIEEFERDVRLMFANATIYNGRGSQVSNMAKEMLAASEVHIAHFKSMQHHLGR